MKFDDLLIRCSAIGNLMAKPKETLTEKQAETINELKAKPKLTIKQEETLNELLKRQNNPPQLSKTAESYLKKLFREEKWLRHQQYSSKYIEKGIREEEASITLLSVIKGVYMRKNTERKSNAYITGEPDIQPVLVDGVKTGYDVKTCWDLFTMPFPDEEIDSDYEWQNRGYMELFGADRWVTAYCLVNAPGSLIWREKEKVFYALGSPKEGDDSYVVYLKKCIDIEMNHIFDIAQYYKDNPPSSLYHDLTIKDLGTWTPENPVFDIPKEQRIVEFVTNRDIIKANLIYEKVKASRKFMNENHHKWEKIAA